MSQRFFDFPRALRWGMLIAWMVAIFCFSAQPHSAEITEHVFGGYNLIARKTAHMVEYAILYLLARNAFRRGGLIEFVFCVAYAGTDEFHQAFVPGRSSAPSDVIIDSAGALIAWLSTILWTRIRKPSKQ